MNQPFKLFFDECCSKKLARKIKDIYDECYPKLETKHLSEFCSTGTDDQDWLARLALHYAYYNFVKVHQTIRCTPAMEAGVANSAWTVQDLVTMTGA